MSVWGGVESIAYMGQVPECGYPAKGEVAGWEALREFVKAVEAKPMPGKHEFAGVGEGGLVDALRLERHAAFNGRLPRLRGLRL